MILDGPAQVDGTVEESLWVLNGDVDVSGTVEGDVVVFNGDVVIRSTAEIGGDLVTQSTPTVEEGATIRGDRSNPMTRFDYDFTVNFAGRIAWWIGYSVSVLILGMLLLAFAPRVFPKVRDAAVTDVGSSIGWGFGLFFLLPIGSVLLLVTVVGIPLGVFTLLALAFLYTLGYVVATIGLGSRVLSVDTVAVRGVPRRLGHPPTARPDPVRRRMALVPRQRLGSGIAGRGDPSRPRRCAGGTATTDAPRARRRGLALRAAPGPDDHRPPDEV